MCAPWRSGEMRPDGTAGIVLSGPAGQTQADDWRHWIESQVWALHSKRVKMLGALDCYYFSYSYVVATVCYKAIKFYKILRTVWSWKLNRWAKNLKTNYTLRKLYSSGTTLWLTWVFSWLGCRLESLFLGCGRQFWILRDILEFPNCAYISSTSVAGCHLCFSNLEYILIITMILCVFAKYNRDTKSKKNVTLQLTPNL